MSRIGMQSSVKSLGFDNTSCDGLQITGASWEEYSEVRLFYHSLIDSMQGSPFHPMWQKDIYPSQEDLQTAVREHSLYVGRAGRRIAAAMVLNQRCNEEYNTALWIKDLQPDEYMVIHMLGVHSDFAGNGYAKQMVLFALDHARSAGMKAVRLDVLRGNLPAEKLYERLGFRHTDTRAMYYEDTGWTDFMLYEYDLEVRRDGSV